MLVDIIIILHKIIKALVFLLEIINCQKNWLHAKEIIICPITK